MGRRWLDQPRYLLYIERATSCHLLTRVADPPLRPGIPWPPLSGMVGISALQRPNFAETVHYMEHCSCLRRREKMGVLGSLLGICTWLLLIPKEDTVGNITCFHVNHLWSKECCVINACGMFKLRLLLSKRFMRFMHWLQLVCGIIHGFLWYWCVFLTAGVNSVGPTASLEGRGGVRRNELPMFQVETLHRVLRQNPVSAVSCISECFCCCSQLHSLEYLQTQPLE